MFDEVGISHTGERRDDTTAQIKENELSTANTMEESLPHKVEGEHVEENVAYILM